MNAQPLYRRRRLRRARHAQVPGLRRLLGRWSGRWLAAFGGVWLLSAGNAARASPAGLTIEAATDIPMSVGLRSRYELPFGLRLSLGAGVVPKLYVDGINAVVRGLGAYDEATAQLIANSLESSLMISPALGYRPFPTLGLYTEAGYRFVALGGSATAAELIAGLTENPVPETPAEGSRAFSAASTLHMASIEVGYEWQLAPQWLLRAALGGAFTLSAQTSIEPEFEPRAPLAVRGFADEGERYLEQTQERYIHTPYIGVSAGYILLP